MGALTSELGWPSDWAYPRQVVVEPGGDQVWLILQGQDDLGGAIHACLVHATDGRATRCTVIDDGHDLGGPGRIHHAFGDGVLLTVVDGAGGSTRYWLLGEGGLVSEGRLDLEQVTNVFWNPDGRHFEVYRGTVTNAEAWVERARIASDGQVHRDSPVRVSEGLPARVDMLFAVLPGSPPAAIYPGAMSGWIRLQDARAEPLALPPCLDWAADCIEVASSARAGLSRAPVWLDNRGQLRIDLLDAAALGSGAFGFLVEHLEHDGGSRPLRTVETGPTGDRRIEATMPWGDRLSLRVAKSGLESVLMGRLDSSSSPPDAGEWRPIARQAGDLHHWDPIPTRGGLLLLYRRIGMNPPRLVVLNERLEVQNPPALSTRLAAIVARRFDLDPLATSLYLLLLLAFAPLFGLGVRALLRARLGVGSAWVVALFVYAVAGAVLAVLNADYLFPPI